MSKKAYYFTLDALIALIILSVGFILITTSYSYTPSGVSTQHLADDTLNLLQSAKVHDFCDLTSCSIVILENLRSSLNIKNYNNTLLELVGELANRTLESEAENLVKEIIENSKIIPPNYHYAFNLTGKDIFKSTVSAANSMSDLETKDEYKKTKLLVASKRIVLGYYIDSGFAHYWGPYTAEVRIWQK